MAAARPAAPIGCAVWLANERDKVDLLVGQESEEFLFSATNEVEWLNEHVNDIFQRTEL